MRSPLLALDVGGTVAIDVEMHPEPIGLAGLDVEVAAETAELLVPLGLTPTSLGARWIDREDLDAMQMPGLVKDVLRWQNIPGLTVRETEPTQTRPFLCVSVGRGRRGCAVVYLDGIRLPLEQAFYLDPRELEAIAVLNPIEAATFYGTDGANGVLIMWMRRGRR